MSQNLENALVTDEENGLFYFESDHLALKGNKDYSDVLKTIVILCAQRERALKDFGKIVELRKQCLQDPLETVRKLQEGDDLGIPPFMELPKLPVIDFDKYDAKVPESDLKEIYSDQPGNQREETKNAVLNASIKNSSLNHKIQAWTSEEQKRLEELLVIYPSEDVEMRRFQKIADALGNRSVQQVSSRVQKYFIKLYKAGLPIPGRVPKKIEKYAKARFRKSQKNSQELIKYSHDMLKPTTFFPNSYVPVVMDEEESVPGPSMNSAPVTEETRTSNYLITNDYQHKSVSQPKNEAELQLQLLERVKRIKLQERENGVNTFQHYGFRCDYCNIVPLTGYRWHCISCSNSIDFCTDCVVSQMYSNNSHPFDHILVVFHNDKEYPKDEDLPPNEVENNNCDINNSDSSDDSDSMSSRSSTEDSEKMVIATEVEDEPE